jgi:hypothetical protein
MKYHIPIEPDKNFLSRKGTSSSVVTVDRVALGDKDSRGMSLL